MGMCSTPLMGCRPARSGDPARHVAEWLVERCEADDVPPCADNVPPCAERKPASPDKLVSLVDRLGVDRHVMVLVKRYLIRYLEARSVGPRSVRRLFIGALVLAIKFEEDGAESNRRLAARVGLGLSELNAVERHVLRTIGFRLVVAPDLALADWAADPDMTESLRRHYRQTGRAVSRASAG